MKPRPLKDQVEQEVDPGSLVYDDRGLLPVVVQEVGTGAVLMLAWANREAIQRTLDTGQVHFFSRSRNRLWRKGETSGNVLAVAEILADCDRDALLVRAHAAGPACHRGTRTCFEPNPARLELGWLAAVIDARRGADPAESYTARLLAAGIERAAQKVGEEGVEVALAAVSARTGESTLASEAADLLYHLLVLLAASGLSPEEVARELQRRATPTPSSLAAANSTRSRDSKAVRTAGRGARSPGGPPPKGALGERGQRPSKSDADPARSRAQARADRPKSITARAGPGEGAPRATARVGERSDLERAGGGVGGGAKAKAAAQEKEGSRRGHDKRRTDDR